MKLLIIDPQVDFCMPGAALYVKGADEDMARLSEFINKNAKEIESIDISLDMHEINSIFHPEFWLGTDLKHPSPFISISLDDVSSGKWKPADIKDYTKSVDYLKTLEKNKSYPLTIWPPHCIAGISGSNIFPTLYTALKFWMNETGKSFTTHIKGMDRYSEHYGIFKSEGEDKYGVNHELIEKLFSKGESKEIYVSGEAKSHCVAMSLKQLMDVHPYVIPQITLLENTTSNVTGCEHIADEIYENLKKAGMKDLNVWSEIPAEGGDSEVTHGEFFGENLNRAKKVFFPKKMKNV